MVDCALVHEELLLRWPAICTDLLYMLQVPSMSLCSIFSIVAGGSLGPEAPIVALSAGVVSYISKDVLNHKGRMLRYCTLMGMGAALAAFFGVGIGGKGGILTQRKARACSGSDEVWATVLERMPNF